MNTAKNVVLLGYNLKNYYLVCVCVCACVCVCVGGGGGDWEMGTYFWWEGGKNWWGTHFQGYLRNSMQNFQALIKNNVEFPRETKENSCEISRGLGSWTCNFRGM